MRVLVLDGDADLQRVLGSVLKGDVQMTSHLLPAEATAALLEGVPDVVMVDLDLPGRAAIPFLAALKEDEAASGARVLLKSDFFDEEHDFVEQAKGLCASPHFLKGPVSLLDLADFVARLASLDPEEGSRATSAVWSNSNDDGVGAPSSAGRVAGDPTADAPDSGAKTGRRRSVAARALRAQKSTGRSGPPARPGRSMARIERLLIKDVKKLAAADGWTVLGIPRSADSELVTRAVARLVKRYGDLVQDRALSDRGREAAGQLLTWVCEAAAHVRADGAAELDEVAGAEGAEPLSDGQSVNESVTQALLTAKEALAKGRPARAVGILRRARYEALDNPEVLIWLGWALYKDDAGGRQDRLGDALAMLQLGDSFDPHHPDGQVFLAQVEAESGDRLVAMDRLAVLLRRQPDHGQARRLRERLLRQLEPASPGPRGASQRTSAAPPAPQPGLELRPEPATPAVGEPEPASGDEPEPVTAEPSGPRTAGPAWGLEIEDDDSDLSDLSDLTSAQEPAEQDLSELPGVDSPKPAGPGLESLDDPEDESSGSEFTWS